MSWTATWIMALFAVDGIVTIKSSCKWHMCGPSTFLSINSSFLIKISFKLPIFPSTRPSKETACTNGEGEVYHLCWDLGEVFQLNHFAWCCARSADHYAYVAFWGNLSIFEALYWYSFQHEAKDFLRSLRYSLLELSSFLYQLGNVVCWKDGASRQKWFQI